MFQNDGYLYLKFKTFFLSKKAKLFAGGRPQNASQRKKIY